MTEEPTPNMPNKAALSKIEEKLKTNPPAPLPTASQPQFDASTMLNTQENLAAQGSIAARDAAESHKKDFVWSLDDEKKLIEAMRRCGNFDDLAKMVGRSKVAVQQKIGDMMREKTFFAEARKVLLR
jgi:hypothetical protein